MTNDPGVVIRLRATLFELRVPNPLYLLNLRLQWRLMVQRKSLAHIKAVNAKMKHEILSDEYVYPYVSVGKPNPHVRNRRPPNAWERKRGLTEAPLPKYTYQEERP